MNEHAAKKATTTTADPAAVLAHTDEAFVAMDAEGCITGWNPAAEKLLGWSADQALGRRLSDTIIPPEYRGAHEQGRRHFVDTGFGPIIGTTIDVEALTRHGSRVPVRLTVSSIPGADGHSFCGFLADRTDSQRNERVLRTSERSAWILAAARGFEDNGRSVHQDLASAFGDEMSAEVAIWWEDRDQELVMDASWSRSAEGERFTQASQSMTFRRGVGLPGIVAQEQEPQWVTEVTDDERYLRTEQASASRLSTGIFVPVPSDRGSDVLELISNDARPADSYTLSELGALGRRIGRALGGAG